MDKKAVIRELATRNLEKRHKQESDNYIDFVKYWFKEGKKFDFEADEFHYLIAKYLEKCYRGEITRLIINIPPRHWKTEMITKCFPAWVLGKAPDTKIIVTGYSSTLTQQFSLEAKDIVTSSVYKNVFPRHGWIREEQNTKEYWVLNGWGSYYATGTGGSITGKGAWIFLIDDPIKPDEAESDIIRTGINNWFENTVPSRLDNPNKGCIIIIMQRTHEDDLCGHLIERMKNKTWDDWTVLSMPAIAENDEFIQVDDYVYKRLKWEVLHPKRFNPDGIEKIRKNMNNSTFECQYQQNPISKESQEFHTEWFKYIDRDQVPTGGRTFTTVDPAWTKQSYSDYTSILTGKFIDDKLYILWYTAWKFDPAEAIDEIVKHIKLYNPEKIGVEAIQAKGVLSVPLRNTCQTMGIYANIEEIAQKGDKESRIRKLIPLFRDWLIYFVRWIEDGQPVSMEKQLLTFPRWKHDDVIDSLQMVYDLYTLQPNTHTRHRWIKVTYHNWRPVLSK